MTTKFTKEYFDQIEKDEEELCALAYQYRYILHPNYRDESVVAKCRSCVIDYIDYDGGQNICFSDNYGDQWAFIPQQFFLDPVAYCAEITADRAEEIKAKEYKEKLVTEALVMKATQDRLANYLELKKEFG